MRALWILTLTAVAGTLAGAAPATHPAPGSPAEQALAREVRTNGWLVFSARTDRGDWDLFVMRPDGSERRNLTNTPEHSEIMPVYAPDGTRMLFRRMMKGDVVDGNRYGQQGQLMMARTDATNAVALGGQGEHAWACFSPDGTSIATLDAKGIRIVDLASRQVTRTIERRKMFQQLTWSPDGKSFGGVSNGFGAAWTVARMDLESGKINAVSGAECCTPDWFPDGKTIIYSNRLLPQKANNGYGWTQLWRAKADGTEARLLVAAEGRHLYGGQVSPDGKYVVFTGNVKEDGDPQNRGAPMSVIRVADTPIIVGDMPETREKVPQSRTGPVLMLPSGFEPVWVRDAVFAAARQADGKE